MFEIGRSHVSLFVRLELDGATSLTHHDVCCLFVAVAMLIGPFQNCGMVRKKGTKKPHLAP